MQISLGPLTQATPASPRASGRAGSLQNWSPARVRERGDEGAEAGAPGPSSRPGERSAPGLPAGWGLLRPSARSCLGEGLTRRPNPGRPGGRRRKGCCKGRSRDCGVCVGGRGPYSPWPAASASAAPTAASAVHPCGGGPVAAALE